MLLDVECLQELREKRVNDHQACKPCHVDNGHRRKAEERRDAGKSDKERNCNDRDR